MSALHSFHKRTEAVNTIRDSHSKMGSAMEELHIV